MRDNSAPGIVYGLYCTCHQGKIRYVGISTARGDRNRLVAHRSASRRGGNFPVYKWMRKHGEENIDCRILQRCATRAELLAAEMLWIEKLKTRIPNPGGLNVTPGGDGGKGGMSPETLAKRAETMRSRYPNWGKGRPGRGGGRARGEGIGVAKLTEEIVSEIKSLAWDSVSQKEIASRLGLTRSNTSSIVRGLTWAHVPWPSDRPRVSVTVSERKKAEASLRSRDSLGRFGPSC